MSAGEVERLVELSSGTGGDEEEEWLYGGTELPVCLPGSLWPSSPASQAQASGASHTSPGRPELGRARPAPPGPRPDPQPLTARWTRAKEAGQPRFALLPTVPASSLLRSLFMPFLSIPSCFGVPLARWLLGALSRLFLSETVIL